uniref:Uncharacterized protein n=1 Tax=Glossina brevipalpis TaxID=37001 RepID=A0A1A9W279_9MUSC
MVLTFHTKLSLCTSTPYNTTVQCLQLMMFFSNFFSLNSAFLCSALLCSILCYVGKEFEKTLQYVKFLESVHRIARFHNLLCKSTPYLLKNFNLKLKYRCLAIYNNTNVVEISMHIAKE